MTPVMAVIVIVEITCQPAKTQGQAVDVAAKTPPRPPKRPDRGGDRGTTGGGVKVDGGEARLAAWDESPLPPPHRLTSPPLSSDDFSVDNQALRPSG